MRQMLCCALLLGLTLVGLADEKPKETKEAQKTRELLKKKITVEFKNTAMRSAMDELKEEVKGLKIVFGTGVSGNRMITYKAKDKPVADILSDICKNVGGIGWIVVSDPKPKASYNGAVQLRVGSERGYEKK